MLPNRIVHRILLIILIAVVIPAAITGGVFYLQRAKALEMVSRELKVRFSEIENRVNSKIEETGKAMVRQKALDTALEIELYLKLHPSTLKELINDPDFQQIAVQPMGERGYTFVIAPSLRITVAHSNERIAGAKYTRVISSSPRLVRMFEEAQKGMPVEGFYRWSAGENEPPVKKFAFLTPVGQKTTDGVLLVVGATSPVSEFINPLSVSKDVFRSSVVRMKGFLRSSSRNLILFVMGIFLVSIVLGCTLSFLLASHITNSITALKEGMEKVNRGDLSVKIESSNTGELKELEDAFNSMVERLRSTTISREFLDTVIHSLPSGVALVDREMRVLFWNKAAEEITGFSEEDALGKGICELLRIPSGRPVCEAFVPPAMERGEEPPITEVAVSKRGEKLYLLFQFSRAQHYSHREVEGIVSFTDVTRQKQLEQQLSHAQRMEAVGVLAAGIAHDFNNMLGAIMGNLNLISLIVEEGGDKDEIAKYAASAEQVVHQAAQITKRLLAFTRQAPVVMKPMDPRPIVEETREILSRTIDRRITVESRLDDNVWQVRADPAELQQILMNLCLNAKDTLMDRIEGRCPHKGSLKDDPPRLLISVENQVIGESYVLDHPYAKMGKFVRFSVEDNGCGMDEEVLDRIFDPFFTTKELEKGTGLGLATVYGLVKQHRGWITAESRKGVGSRFSFYLPALATPVKATDSEKEETTSTSMENNNTRLKVLLVDDEEIIRDIGKTMLTHMGYQVILAENGEEAIELYKSARPDLVILDITMPVLSGKDALKRIMEIDPNAKVIISSGHPFDSSAEELLQMGAKLYLQKPFKIKEIKEAIEKVMA